MPSFISWLDYSEHEKRKMLDVINLFRERDTRDELGIGTVRDAFSDLLFPGTSTIQTRAKYFLFVPWIYMDIERRRVSSDKVSAEARRMEIKLITSLIDSKDKDGIIGIDARANLKRLPSNIYWQGLGSWGVRMTPESQDAYHRSLDYYYDSARRIQKNDDGDMVSGVSVGNWHNSIPTKPKEFPAEASFLLSKEEAGYLYERVSSRAQGTLLFFLIDNKKVLPESSFPWETPYFVDATLPPELQIQLTHGRNFSVAMYGSALLYNMMLSEKSENRDDQQELIDTYKDAFNNWSENVKALDSELRNWDRAAFWNIVKGVNSRIPPKTESFINTWLDMVFSSGSVADISKSDTARSLIKSREIFLKRTQARLDNTRALEQWSGYAGTNQLNYRWQRPVRAIINDIVKGLNN